MIRIIMKTVVILVMAGLSDVFGSAHLLAKDPPAAARKESVDELNTRIKVLNEELKELEARRAQLARDEAKLRNGGVVIVHPKDSTIISSAAANRYMISRHVEANGVEYMNPKMSMEMAGRHGAWKIKAQVKEADARAKRILDGNPPSQVHGD